MDKAKETMVGGKARGRAGERAPALEPPGPAMPPLTPSADAVAPKRKMQPPADVVALHRLMQRRTSPEAASERNHTGLPDALKAGVERLSGVSLDGVKVYYNSARPARMQALAYTQGAEIYVAPGHEQHLPHEAWHVVQQRQGRVRATTQMAGVAMNDDGELEREAEVMGARARAGGGSELELRRTPIAPSGRSVGTSGPVQRMNLGQLPQNWLSTQNISAVGTTPLVSYSKTGQKYGPLNTLTVNGDRRDALDAAGVENARLGNLLLNDNASPLKNSINNYTPQYWGWNQSSGHTLDPFRYDVTVDFTQNNKTDTLVLGFQHAKFWSGYVTSICDTSNVYTHVNKNPVTMYDLYSTSQRISTDKYSNVHNVSKNNKKTLIAKTSGQKEKSLDAYTKLAGEGARFQCVRRHIQDIQDDSYFYANHPTSTTNTKVAAITFVKLWGCWANTFGKKYDISDSTVATAVKGSLWNSWTAEEVATTALKSKRDYNLERSQAHP